MTNKMFQALTTLALNLLMSGYALAAPIGIEPTSKPATDLPNDVVTSFVMSIDETKGNLFVELSGNFHEYTTLSITDNRGSEIAFLFVKKNQGVYDFDLSKLNSGSYFLVLNMEGEIRIKRFSI